MLVFLGLCLFLCMASPVFASMPVYDEPVLDSPAESQSPASDFKLPKFDEGDEGLETNSDLGVMSVPSGNKSSYWANRKLKFIEDYYDAYPDGFSGWLEYGSYTATQSVGWDYLKKVLGTERFDMFFDEYQLYKARFENGGKLIVYNYFDWYFSSLVTDVILLGSYAGTTPGDTLYYSFATSSQTGSYTSSGNWWGVSGGSSGRVVQCLRTTREFIAYPPDTQWTELEGFDIEYTVRHTQTELNPVKNKSLFWQEHLLGRRSVTAGSPHQSYGPHVGILVGFYHWDPDTTNIPLDNAVGTWPFIESTPIARHVDSITKENPLYFTDEPINWEYVRHFGKDNIPVINTFNDTYSKLTGEHVYWFYLIYGTEKKQSPQVSLFGVAFYGGVPDDVPSKINFSPKKHILIFSPGEYQFYTDDWNDYYPPGAGLLAYNLFPGDSKRPDGKYTSSLENPGIKGLLCDFIPKDLTYIYKAGPFFRDGDFDIPPAYSPPSPDTDLTEGDTGKEDNLIIAFLRRLFVPDVNSLIDKISLETSVSGFTSPVITLASRFNDLYNFTAYDGFPSGIVIWGSDFGQVLNSVFSRSFYIPLVNSQFSLFSLSRVFAGVALTGIMVTSLISTLLSFFTGGKE